MPRPSPASCSYGSPGNGTTGHLSTELFKSMAGIKVAHVPYRGSGPMLLDLVGGQIQMASTTCRRRCRRSRPASSSRSASPRSDQVSTLPDVPPIASVVPGYVAESWFVLMAPAGTPPAIVNKLSAEVDRILKKPDVIERFREPRRRAGRRLARIARDLHRRGNQQVAEGRQGLGGEDRLTPACRLSPLPRATARCRSAARSSAPSR